MERLLRTVVCTIMYQYDRKDMEQKQINNLFVAYWKEMLGDKKKENPNDKKNEPNKSGGTNG